MITTRCSRCKGAFCDPPYRTCPLCRASSRSHRLARESLCAKYGLCVRCKAPSARRVCGGCSEAHRIYVAARRRGVASPPPDLSHRNEDSDGVRMSCGV